MRLIKKYFSQNYKKLSHNQRLDILDNLEQEGETHAVSDGLKGFLKGGTVGGTLGAVAGGALTRSGGGAAVGGLLGGVFGGGIYGGTKYNNTKEAEDKRLFYVAGQMDHAARSKGQDDGYVRGIKSKRAAIIQAAENRRQDLRDKERLAKYQAKMNGYYNPQQVNVYNRS